MQGYILCKILRCRGGRGRDWEKEKMGRRLEEKCRSVGGGGDWPPEEIIRS